MKCQLLSLVAVVLLFLPCVAAVNPAVEKAHNASYHIAQMTLMGGSMCSATAIGPHALLTATHCELPTDDLEIMGQTVGGDAIIVGRIRDYVDHTILLIKNIEFPVWVSVVEKKPSLGDDVFTFGNPGTWTDIFQKGYVAGLQFDTSMEAQLTGNAKPPEILLDFQAYPGTSGSGVFNLDGDLVFVVSSYHEQSDDKVAIAFASAYPLLFSKDELAKATAFTVAPDPAPAPTPGKK